MMLWRTSSGMRFQTRDGFDDFVGQSFDAAIPSRIKIRMRGARNT